MPVIKCCHLFVWPSLCESKSSLTCQSIVVPVYFHVRLCNSKIKILSINYFITNYNIPEHLDTNFFFILLAIPISLLIWCLRLHVAEIDRGSILKQFTNKEGLILRLSITHTERRAAQFGPRARWLCMSAHDVCWQSRRTADPRPPVRV